MQNKNQRLMGPTLLTTTYTVNYLNPGTTTGGTPSLSANLVMFVKHIQFCNLSGAAQTVRVYLGATGGSTLGTSIVPFNLSIPANSVVDRYLPNLRLDVGDFITAGADAANAVSMMIEGEIGLA